MLIIHITEHEATTQHGYQPTAPEGKLSICFRENCYITHMHYLCFIGVYKDIEILLLRHPFSIRMKQVVKYIIMVGNINL